MNLARIVRGLSAPGNPVRRLLAAGVGRLVVPLTGGPPPGLRRGRDVPRREAPVVLVVLPAGPEPLDALLAGLARAVAAPGSPTPVLVLDHEGWPVVRRAGFALEQRFADPSRQGRHLDELRRTYGTDAVVQVDPADPAAAVAAVLGAPVRPLPRLRAPLRRIEGWADRRPS